MTEDANVNPLEPIGLPTYDDLQQESLTDVAQQMRFSELTTAKWILFGVGVFSIVVYGGLFAFAGKMIDAEFEKQVPQLQAQGHRVDPAIVEKMRLKLVYVRRAIAASTITLGVVFCVLAFFVPRYPLVCTSLGFALYVGVQAISAFVDWTSIFSGILLKALIIISLGSAVKTAMAYERQVKRARAKKSAA